MSKAEVQGMIERAKYPWIKALISFLYVYGCRITEAIRMKRKDVWVEGDKLVARISILKKRQTAGPFEQDTHTLKVALTSPFVDIFLGFLDSVEDQERYLWQIGGTWHSARTKAWQEIRRLNPKCTPHIFRHSRLTKLALKGATGLDLMDWAGWADTRPAQAYLHLGGKLAEKFADLVD